MSQTKISFNVLKDIKGNKCCNCNSENNIQYHHIIPLSLGGNDIISNIVPLCCNCHALIHSKKRMASSSLVKAGIEKARKEGKQIGQRKGIKLTTKKSVEAKQIIQKYSKDFNGTLNDNEVIALAKISRNSFYKYKKELGEV